MKKKAIFTDQQQPGRFGLFLLKKGLLLLLLTLFLAQVHAAVIYVKHDVTGAGDGTSWTNAFPTLQEALDVAIDHDEIWVAAGTYKPTAKHGGTGNRRKTFLIDKNIKIYGGFAGTEAQLSQRNWTTNQTILSGDIGVENDSTDNALHVLWLDHLPTTARLDGFTIMDGNADIDEDDDRGRGGGIYNDGSGNGNSSNPQIANCIFEHNTARDGGGIFNDAQEGGNTSPTITDCSFISNRGVIQGGGMLNLALDGGTTSPVLTGCTFDGNYTRLFGAGIFSGTGENSTCEMELYHCDFTNNLALSVIVLPGELPPAEGGQGGGLFLAGGPESNNSPILVDCYFNLNYSAHGGAISMNSNCSPILTDCTFQENGGALGGAIHYAPTIEAHADPILNNCIFEENQATLGGGIYISHYAPATLDWINETRVNFEINDCIFNTNHAVSHGGAIHSYTYGSSSNHTLTNCHFDGNTSEIGGGGAIYNFVHSFSPTQLNLNNCNFANNSTKEAGGAIFSQTGLNAEFHCTKCSFTDNSTETLGGAVANASLDEDTFSPKFSGCQFEGNSANAGGGMFNVAISADCTPEISNSTFIGNAADSLGGALFNFAHENSCSPVLTNCSVSANTSGQVGGVIFSERSADFPTSTCAPVLTNCIVWGNDTGMQNVTATPTISYSIVQGGCPSGSTCSDLLDSDPLFVNQPPIGQSATGDLHLQACSPAIDMGTATGAPATDIEGNNRPYGAGFDIGAYENTGGLPCGWSSNEEGIGCTEGTQAAYDPNMDSFTLTTEGCYAPNYYSNSDAQGFIHQELCGDGEIITHVSNLTGDIWAGIAMRESTAPDAKMIQLAVNNADLAQRKMRTTTGGYAYNHLFQNQGKFWLRLTRTGNQFAAYLSLNGINWDLVLLTNIPMSNCIQTGLFVSNTTPGNSGSASFAQVEINATTGTALQIPNEQSSIANNPMTNTQPPTSQYANTPKTQQAKNPLQRDINIYPNPTYGELNLELNDFLNQSLQLQVLNQQGQLVLTKAYDKYHAPTERIQLQHLPNGSYLVRLTTRQQTITRKVNVIRK